MDTATGERTAYRADDRFPMCSTFKFLLASAVLQRVGRAQESLDRRVTIHARPLLANSPLTEPHAGGTMTISELCHAALTRSDIAVIWPKGGQPVIVAAYITRCPGPEEKRATMLADIGRLVRESVN